MAGTRGKTLKIILLDGKGPKEARGYQPKVDEGEGAGRGNPLLLPDLPHKFFFNKVLCGEF